MRKDCQILPLSCMDFEAVRHLKKQQNKELYHTQSYQHANNAPQRMRAPSERRTKWAVLMVR